MPLHESGQTRRQQLIERLSEREYGFEELRSQLGVAVRLLEDDLRHVERSLHRGERRLVTTEPRCDACDFEFRNRARYAGSGIQLPWKPKGTRCGRRMVATGGAVNEEASSTSRSLPSRPAS